MAGRLAGSSCSRELVVVPGAPARLAWQVLTETDRGTVRTLLDAGTGAVLKEENTVKEVNGSGRVFNPNPVVTLQNESLTDNDNARLGRLRRRRTRR